MGIWSTVGGIAGGVGGFMVGGPAGAMLGYAGGSQLGKLGDEANDSTNSGGRSVGQSRNRGVSRGIYGEAHPTTMNEANRASQLGADQAGQTRALGNELGSHAFHGQTVANSYRDQNAQRAGQLYGDAARSYGAAGGADTMQQGARGEAMAGIGRLQNFYQQGPGPSVAEAQLRQGQDANARNAMSIARTGGGSPSAMRAAMRAGAAGGQQTNQAAAGLRAQEAANWRQTQLGAMGHEQQALGNVRAGDMSAMGQHYGAAGQQQGAAANAANTGLGYGNLGLGYGAQNNQARLGAEGMAIGAGQFGEQQRAGILGNQMSSDTSRYGADQGVAVGMANVAQRDRAADMAMTGSLIGSGVQMMSDVRAKENIRPVSAASLVEQLDQTYGQEEQDVAPRFDMRQASGNAYDYKDPSMGPPNQVGPMAHELERTAASGAVSTGPNGMKQVDPGRLTMVNTSAIGEQQRRLDALETMLDDSNSRASADTGPRARKTENARGNYDERRGAGNIDLYKQPQVRNSDGSISTVDSSGYNLDGQEVLLPSVTPDGRHLRSEREIVGEYRKTGNHLGKFATPEESDRYAQTLHDDYAAGRYGQLPTEQRSSAQPYMAPSTEERDRRMMTFGGVGALRPQDAATLEQKYPKPKKVTPGSTRRTRGERA